MRFWACFTPSSSTSGERFTHIPSLIYIFFVPVIFSPCAPFGHPVAYLLGTEVLDPLSVLPFGMAVYTHSHEDVIQLQRLCIFFIVSKLLIIVRLEQLKHELVSSILEFLTIGSVPDMWHPWLVGHHGILQYCSKALGNGLKEGVIDECKKISETSSDATL